jgi:hypothetical protein
LTADPISELPPTHKDNAGTANRNSIPASGDMRP